MNSLDNDNKPIDNSVGSNPAPTRAPSPSLLDPALNNPIRRKYGFNVLFADINKRPKREWVKWQSEAQKDDDVRALFSTWKPDEATCWGFVCGYNRLEGFDFEWPWVYRLWKAKFGARAETLTVQTPNDLLQYFCLICTSRKTDILNCWNFLLLPNI